MGDSKFSLVSPDKGPSKWSIFDAKMILKLCALCAFASTLFIATLPSGFCQELSVSGSVGLNFSESIQGTELDYTFSDEDFVNLTFKIAPQELAVSVNSIVIGRGTASWSNALTWDSPLLVINTAADFVSLVDHVRFPLQGILSVAGDLHALQNEGPTEYTAPITPIHWEYKHVEIASVSMGIPIKWDVTIPTGAQVNMDQDSVILQSLTVNNGGILAANLTLDTRADLINHGSVTNLGGIVEGNFVNDGAAVSGAGLGISGSLSIQGTFSNPGNITIQSGGTLSLGHTVVNDGKIAIAGGFLTLPGLTNNGVLNGYSAGSLSMNIDNYGSITADVSGNTLSIATSGSQVINNFGSLNSTNGGTLSLSSSTVNGGAINANGGSVTMSSVALNSCTLNGGAADLFTMSGVFYNLVNNAQLLSYNGFGVTGGSVVNNGTITIGAGIISLSAQFQCLTDTNITGNGSIVFNGGGIYSNNSTITSHQLIHGWGNIVIGNINSYAGITADAAGQTFRIGGDGVHNPVINNFASLTARNGGTLAIYSIINGGAINANGGTVLLNGASINGSTLNGGEGDLFSVSLTDLNQVTNNATLIVPGNSSATISGGTLTNNGKIKVGDGTSLASLFLTSSTSILGSGEIVLNNGVITGSVNSTLTEATGSTVSGAGSISTHLINGGTISTGRGGAALTVRNSVTLLGTSTLRFAIGGLLQGTDYGFFAVTGSVGLDGVLDIDFEKGFEADITPEETFTILNSGSLTGLFKNVGNGGRLTTEDGLGSFIVNYGPDSPYGSDNIVLSQGRVVPEPTVFSLVSVGISGLLLFAPRRRYRVCNSFNNITTDSPIRPG